MASKLGKFDEAVGSLKAAIDACHGKQPPAFIQVISDIQEKATAIATEMSGSSCSASAEDHNNFLDTLQKTKKILGKIRRDPRYKRKVDDPTMLEKLQMILKKDLNDFLTRVTKSEAAVTASNIFTRADAKKFWIESFGNKVRYLLQVSRRGRRRLRSMHSVSWMHDRAQSMVQAAVSAARELDPREL